MSSSIAVHPWSEEALFNKARLYLEKMDSNTAEDWQYGFWSALSLEFLARAALAHISPVLLADKQNWRNLTYALGSDPTAKKFSPTSIATKEVFVRLRELVPSFNDDVSNFCAQHSDRRNTELHTGGLAFVSLGTSQWLPKYYFALKVLLESMCKELSDCVSDPEAAQAMIDASDDAAAKAVQQQIEAHALAWKKG
ncbi:MAG: hypothetical protein U1E66_05460 [Rhodospirillales bacterium]